MVSVRTSERPSVRVVGVEDWRVVVLDESGIADKLDLGWPAGGGKYFLDVAEITYLVYKGLCDVYVGNEKFDLASLYSYLPSMDYAWSKFVVLLDLRERGRKAKSGFSPRELFYTKGSQRILVLVLEENALVEASEIAEWVRSAIMREFSPVIAVVDAHGDVTYYSASLSRAQDLGRVYLDEGPSGSGEGD